MELIDIVGSIKEAIDIINPIIKERKVRKISVGENRVTYYFDNCAIRQIGVNGPSGSIEMYLYNIYLIGA